MAERIQYLVAEEIGPNRALTQQGFLLCLDVPLARVGKMNYAAGETPVAVGAMGYVEIERSPDEVFNPASLASYIGAPFVDDHPTIDVCPTNWRDLSHGVVLNARRGDNELNECVVGDILIKSPELIEAVQNGKREVSVGYSCDYDQMEPGRGRQRNIVVNHVALVERGRCGPRCAIGDKAPQEIPVMSAVKTADKGTLIQRTLARLKNAVATKDEAQIAEEIAAVEAATQLQENTNPGAGGPNIHLHLGDEFPPKKKDDDDETEEEKKKRLAKEKADKTDDEGGELEARVAAVEAAVGEIKAIVTKIAGGEGGTGERSDEVVNDEKILGALQMEAPPGTSDAAIKSTKDSSILTHAFQETISLAEVLAPGIQPPTFDVKLPPAKTFDSICKHRRAALSLAHGTPQMRTFIDDNMPRGMTFATMTCDQARTLFKTSAALKSAMNNGVGKVAVTLPGPGAKVNSKVTSIADLNKIGKEKYGAHH